MFLAKNRLFVLMLISLVAVKAVYGQSWLSQLNLSRGRTTRQIQLLAFDRTNSNISEYQASRALDGFFTGLNAQGTYRINLSREYVGHARGNDAVLVGACIGTILTAGFGVLFLPIGRYEYRCTVKIAIRDVDGRLVKDVTKSDTYAISETYSDKITTLHQDKISEAFSSLVSRARDELNYNAAAINNRLRSAAQSFEKNFNELSANISNGTVIALLPISGPDAAENKRVLGEFTRSFVNSGRYFVVNREHLDKVIAEMTGHGSHFFDQSTAVQVGRFVGARVIIIGRVDVVNNSRQLVIQAVDCETTQTLGISVANF
jgi:gas vesicle protein